MESQASSLSLVKSLGAVVGSGSLLQQCIVQEAQGRKNQGPLDYHNVP